VEKLFEDWKNPCFQHKNTISHTLKEVSLPVANRLQFTKEQVRSMKVIKQLDNKFILAKLDSLLVILDQHAVDERIRLEKLQKESPYDFITPRNINPVQWEVSLNEKGLLASYQTLLETWGWQFSVVAKQEQTLVEVYKVPTLYGMPFDKEDFFSFLEDLAIAKGSSNCSPIKGITKVLCYKACRSAIMFGTPLTTNECQDLIQELANCDIPFQCAHGYSSFLSSNCFRKAKLGSSS
jgi:DNA mismatch repair protein MLH3